MLFVPFAYSLQYVEACHLVAGNLANVFGQIAFFVHGQQVVDAGNRLYASQLEHPPYQYLYREQRVAVPCGKGRCHHDGERHPGVEYVATRNIVVVSSDNAPLPQGERQQYGRENQLHQVVGYEDDAETDDYERHQHNGRVNAETALDLVTFDAYKQRYKDDT